MMEYNAKFVILNSSSISSRARLDAPIAHCPFSTCTRVSISVQTIAIKVSYSVHHLTDASTLKHVLYR